MSSIVQGSYQFIQAFTRGVAASAADAAGRHATSAAVIFWISACGGCYTRKFGLWRSLASALAWGARGPGFKSRQPDQIPQRLTESTASFGGVLESNWSPKWVPGRQASPTR